MNLKYLAIWLVFIDAPITTEVTIIPIGLMVCKMIHNQWKTFDYVEL